MVHQTYFAPTQIGRITSMLGISRRTFGAACFGVICSAAAFIYGRVAFRTQGNLRSPPNFEFEVLLRTAFYNVVCFAAAMCLLWAMFRAAQERNSGPRRGELELWPALPAAQFYVAATVLMAAIVPCVLVFSPALFNAGAQEDGPIEWASAILSTLASLSCAALAWRRFRTSAADRATTLLIALCALVFLLIAGEEVSWFQRLLDIKTPGTFDRNLQGEMNLHNFLTNPIETAYYFMGGFAFMVAAPMWRMLGLPSGRLAPLLPGPQLIAIGAMMTAFNYDMWNEMSTRFAFWGSIIVLAALALRAHRAKDRYFAWVVLILTAAAQLLFINFGYRSVPLWSVTEYKEMLIPAGFLLYSRYLWQSEARQ